MITYALIDKGTKEAVQSWTQIPGRIEVEGKLRVDGAAVGWSDDEYEIIEIATPDPDPVAEDATMRARIELDASDTVALRCFKAGVAWPQDWKDYCDALRNIVRGGGDTLPVRPPYPTGT